MLQTNQNNVVVFRYACYRPNRNEVETAPHVACQRRRCFPLGAASIRVRVIHGIREIGKAYVELMLAVHRQTPAVHAEDLQGVQDMVGRRVILGNKRPHDHFSVACDARALPFPRTL